MATTSQINATTLSDEPENVKGQQWAGSRHSTKQKKKKKAGRPKPQPYPSQY